MLCPGGPYPLTLGLDIGRLARTSIQGLHKCRRPTARQLKSLLTGHAGVLAASSVTSIASSQSCDRLYLLPVMCSMLGLDVIPT